jgi:putative nucleotidyltransferase with HDIG domain
MFFEKIGEFIKYKKFDDLQKFLNEMQKEDFLDEMKKINEVEFKNKLKELFLHQKLDLDNNQRKIEEQKRKIDEQRRKIDEQRRKIDNNLLFVDEVITLTLRLLELRDPYTFMHSRSVTDICIKIAHEAKLNIDVDVLRYSSLLYDIGKIGIGDYVLNKSIKLSRSEYIMMQQHTVLGYEAVKNLSIAQEIKDAILYHHESFDGTGYPTKLAGKDIPLIARIIKIADVYNALTTDRPYRQAFSKKDALEIMSAEKNQYDPELFDIFKMII